MGRDFFYSPLNPYSGKADKLLMGVISGMFHPELYYQTQTCVHIPGGTVGYPAQPGLSCCEFVGPSVRKIFFCILYQFLHIISAVKKTQAPQILRVILAKIVIFCKCLMGNLFTPRSSSPHVASVGYVRDT